MLDVSSDPQDNSDLFDGFGNGSLHLYVVCAPGWKPYDSGDARYLDLDFHVTDWEALFLGFLNVPAPWVPYVEGEAVTEHHEKSRKNFHESLPDFPMLRRIFDMYEDYRFDVTEVEALRQECATLMSRTPDPAANIALRKLLYGCDNALHAQCDLMFVCD